MVEICFVCPTRGQTRQGKRSSAILQSAVPLVEAENGTIAWFAMQMGPSTFGIFDMFNDESGREAHLSGKVAAALMAKAPDLFAKPPQINKLDILASKIPAGTTQKASA